MNIWHDIEPERIYPTDFTAVVEISKGSNMNWIRKPVCCLWTECCLLQRIIP